MYLVDLFKGQLKNNYFLIGKNDLIEKCKGNAKKLTREWINEFKVVNLG